MVQSRSLSRPEDLAITVDYEQSVLAHRANRAGHENDQALSDGGVLKQTDE